MALLDQLLKIQLSEKRAVSAESAADPHEEPLPYTRWAPGLRTVLRLRYVTLKKQVLHQYRRRLEYNVDSSRVRGSILDKLMARSDSHGHSRGLWSYLVTPLVAYPLLAVLLATLAFGIYSDIKAGQQRSVFRNDIPGYSDAIYRQKAEQARQTPDADIIAALELEAATMRARVLRHFASYPEIRWFVVQLLDAVASNDVRAKEMIQHTKPLNDLLHAYGIPYYISTITETTDCSELPAESFLARLFGGVDNSGELCRVHVLLAFHIDEYRFYSDGTQDHLAFFMRRVDQLDIQEAYLGRVHVGDDRAQILLGNIAGASSDSLTAVSNGTLKTKLMPQGMPDVYGLESLARRLQSNVINSYAAEIDSHWWSRFQPLWNELTGESPKPLAYAGNRLQQRIADVTAFHEVQHLVDHFTSLEEPEWLSDTLSVFGNRVASDAMRQHILWELSAFFSHLAHADELQGVLLNDFTAITLDPMLQDQPHFYSIRILLPILHQTLKGELEMPPVAARSLSDVARAYKALALNAGELGRLAREAYPVLFGRPLVDLSEVHR